MSAWVPGVTESWKSSLAAEVCLPACNGEALMQMQCFTGCSYLPAMRVLIVDAELCSLSAEDTASSTVDGMPGHLLLVTASEVASPNSARLPSADSSLKNRPRSSRNQVENSGLR